MIPTPRKSGCPGAAWIDNRASLVAEGKTRIEADRLAVVEVCHTLLNTSEFLYRE
ncbi:MAG: hypothetical protein Ct9H300mP1_13380 [Planctomycetaceae bacterium]|nr:MAG: hypothetical protein Ct9H300mP1_13380 [Planctomycetaceae bacterium]